MRSCRANKRHDFYDFQPHDYDYQSHDYVGLIFFYDFLAHDFHDFWDFYGLACVSFDLEPTKKRPVFWSKMSKIQIFPPFYPPQPGINASERMHPGSHRKPLEAFCYRGKVFIYPDKKRPTEERRGVFILRW
jgi:hypothetical protein